MKTDIPYLEKLEVDLRNAATRATVRRPPAKPRSAVWGRRLGVVAAVLVVATLIGGLAGTSGFLGSGGDGSSSAAGKFNQVGSAVGGGNVPAPERDALGYLDDEGSQPQESPVPAAPADPEQQPGTDLAKIDRDGSITLKIGEGSLGTTFTDVIGIAESYDGMLLSSETVGDDTARLVLRIPAKKFDRAFAEVSQLGDVRASTVTGTDVTAEFIDLQAQLRILKAHREVVFGLYEQATTIDTTLRLDRELSEVQLQIDQIQGQLRYLDAQTSISTLKVAMSENEPDVEALSEDDEAPSLGNAWDSATDGFLGVLSAMIVGLGYLIPLAIVAGIVYAVVRLVRRRDPGAS